MPQPILWERDTTLHTLSGIQPQLASWEKTTHPSQIRLQVYRQRILDELLHLSGKDAPLFLHLDVDVQKADYLVKHHDLENYLTPLFGIKWLDPSRFVLVTARKYVGGGSKLEVGVARPAHHGSLHDSWNHCTCTAQCSVQSKQWKESLRHAIALANPLPLDSPAVEVQIAWVCSPIRNWVMLWKPTGDCMGPILGEENPLRPFAPKDDRIVGLQFHRTTDTRTGNDVRVDIWWRAANPDYDGDLT